MGRVRCNALLKIARIRKISCEINNKLVSDSAIPSLGDLLGGLSNDVDIKRYALTNLKAFHLGISICRTRMNSKGMNIDARLYVVDPSEVHRPEIKFAKKDITKFRDYTVDDNDPIKERVRKTYHEMHTRMTVDFVKGKMSKWLKFDKFKANIMDALVLLDNLIDESDPDVNIPNSVHAFQTAERIREEHPQHDWFHLTGLIHDLGKVMALFGEPQWCVVGDTFPVGCRWGDSIVYRDTSFEGNPDGKDKVYQSEYGIYSPNCGLDQLLMSWGHDEYLYQVLKHNKCKLPEQALYIIRYHSFYPWHTGGDYKHLCNEKDSETLKWVLEFNKYDLYTKSSAIPDIEALKTYYQSLIDKYIPGELEW